MTALLSTANCLIRERVRRVSTILFLCLHVVYFFLPFPASVKYSDARGLFTSGYIGAFTAMRSLWIFILMAFHVSRSSIDEDHRDGIGEILASTSMKKVTYILGKLLGCILYLCILLVVVYTLTLASQVIHAEGPLQPLSIAWSFVLFTVPAVIFTAGLGMTMQMIPLLKQWPGDILFIIFFLFNKDISQSLSGDSILTDHIHSYLNNNPNAITIVGQEKAFYWPGMPFAWNVILPRMLWVLLGIGLAAFASVLFDRFRVPHGRRWGFLKKVDRTSTNVSLHIGGTYSISLPESPSRSSGILWSSVIALLAEILLVLKRRWWYLLGCIGFAIATFIVSGEDLTLYVLPMALLLPVGAIADLGSRERRSGTHELVLTAPYKQALYPLWKWGSGFVLACLALMGPVFLHFSNGRLTPALALMTGVVFLVSMAVSFSILTGGYRLFVIIYVFLWWLLVNGINKYPPKWLDWSGVWYGGEYPLILTFYLYLSIILLGFASIKTNGKKLVEKFHK